MTRLLCAIVLCLFAAASVSAQEDRLIVEATVSATTETAYDVVWHPAGDLLAVTGGASVTIYDTHLQPVSEPLAPQGVNLAWSPDGNQLATVEGSRARRIRLWDWNADARTVEESSPIVTVDDQYAVTWSPDGASLVTLNDDRGRRNIVTLWDIASRRQVWSVRLSYPQALRVLDWNGAEIHGAGKNAEGILMLYEIDPADGSVTDLRQLDADVSLFAFSPDDSRLATITEAGELTIFDAASAEALLTLDALDTPVNIAFSPDAQSLAVLNYHRQMQIWDIGEPSL